MTLRRYAGQCNYVFVAMAVLTHIHVHMIMPMPMRVSMMRLLSVIVTEDSVVVILVRITALHMMRYPGSVLMLVSVLMLHRTS